MLKKITQINPQRLNYGKSLLAICCLITSLTVKAADFTWLGGTDNKWSTLANWTVGNPAVAASALPGPTDNVKIFSGTVEIASDENVAVNSIRVGCMSSAKATLNITAGATLTINQTTAGSYGGAIQLTGGTVNNNGGTINITSTSSTNDAYGIFLNEVDYNNPTANSTFNQSAGTLTVTMVGTGSNHNPIWVRQRNGGGNPTLTLGGTVTLTPVSGTGSGNYVINCISSNFTINGTGTISAGSPGNNVSYGLIRIIGDNASYPYKITIGSGVTLNSYSTGFKSTASPYSGPIYIQTNTNSATLINEGTINIGGNSESAIHITSVEGKTFPFMVDNTGTINLNGSFGAAAIYIAGKGTGSSKILNQATGNINYNTTSNNTSANPFIIQSSSNTFELVNDGTISVGSVTPLTNAISLYDSNSKINNNGTLNVGSGIISTSSNATSNSVVFNNSVTGSLNFNSTSATSPISTNYAFANEGSYMLAPKGTINMNVRGTTSAGTDYDQIVSKAAFGIVDLTNASLALNITASNPTPGTISLISCTGNFESISGTFKSVTGLVPGWTIGYTPTSVTLTNDGTGVSAVSEVYDYDYSKISVNKNGIITKFDGDIKIYSLSGKMIKSQKTSIGRSIQLVNGVYILKIQTGDKQTRLKIII